MTVDEFSPKPNPPKAFRAVLVPESEDALINTVGLSQDFQKLLSRLAQQHLFELAEQRKNLPSHESSRFPMEAQIQISKLKEEVAALQASKKTQPEASWELMDVGDENLPGIPSSPEKIKEAVKETSKEISEELSKPDVLSAEELRNEPVIQKDPGFYMKMRSLLSSVMCDLLIGALILLNVVFMFMQCHYDGIDIGHRLQPNGKVYENFPYWIHFPLTAREQWPGMGEILQGVDFFFTIVFTVDVALKVIFLGLPFWKSALNILDFLVVGLGLYALADASFQNPSYMRMLRLAKIGRLAGALANSPAAQSLQMLLKCIGNCVNTLSWSVSVLMVIQSIMGLTISSLVQNILDDPDALYPDDIRQTLFYYYGTFSKTIFTMFEILFANWIPCARILIDNVSEYFSLFFIFYRCLVGFAVMSVISAVFVQSTMKVAQQDQELLIAQKQRDREASQRNLKALFHEIDTSGDGFLSRPELLAVVDEPKMALFMHALDIDTKDLTTLFDLLDDGDGEISVEEFLGGIGRLRGAAKAIDMAAVMASCSKIENMIKSLESGKPALKSRKSMAMKDW